MINFPRRSLHDGYRQTYLDYLPHVSFSDVHIEGIEKGGDSDNL